MRKLISLMHVSLDGFVAGANGEMDWIHVDGEMFDIVGRLTDEADTALFGRATYEMMESYWPTAADQPNATKHDIEHANWVNNAIKLVFSRTLKETKWKNSKIISDGIADKIQLLKTEPGKNMLMIGSAATAHTFMRLGLIDEFHLYVNPVVLGNGIPLFKGIKNTMNMKLLDVKTFKAGVVGLYYRLDR